MNTKSIYNILLLSLGVLLAGCGNTSSTKTETSQDKTHHNDEVENTVQLSTTAFESLAMKVDTLPMRLLSGVVEVNGHLEVPPQYEATVTAVVGANVTSIRVIEGEKVNKGGVLAYLSHPDLIKLQTNYVQAYNQLQFLEKEMQRQKRLYEAEVGSGKKYQKAKAQYQSKKALVNGLAAQLQQLHLDVGKIRAGNLYQNVPVRSPITGYIEKVKVSIGEYVSPNKTMFAVINTAHVHADLMVFEKDVHKVKEGQIVTFEVQSKPDKTYKAEVISVGKNFEEDPRAVHLHAEIINEDTDLIAGMYIHGKIQTKSKKVMALPNEAVITDNGKPYIFTAKLHNEEGEKEWTFTPVEVRTGITTNGWTAIKLLSPLSDSTQVAWNNAYYLISEMKKGSAGHHH